jgi:hypothetical protein
MLYIRAIVNLAPGRGLSFLMISGNILGVVELGNVTPSGARRTIGMQAAQEA